MASAKPVRSMMAKGRSPKPPGSRTENHSKTRIKDSYSRMEQLATPKLDPKSKPKLK